jgi:hypothetical protein
MEDLNTLLLATDKYVYLDISGSAITSIGEYAFEDCTSLTSVTFQGTITASGFSDGKNPFGGDLRDKYLAGGPGTYKTTAPVNISSVWVKQ